MLRAVLHGPSSATSIERAGSKPTRAQLTGVHGLTIPLLATAATLVSPPTALVIFPSTTKLTCAHTSNLDHPCSRPQRLPRTFHRRRNRGLPRGCARKPEPVPTGILCKEIRGPTSRLGESAHVGAQRIDGREVVQEVSHPLLSPPDSISRADLIASTIGVSDWRAESLSWPRTGPGRVMGKRG